MKKMIKLSLLILFLLLLAYPANAATIDLVRSTVDYTDNVDQGGILEFVWSTLGLSNEEVRYLIKDIPSEFNVDDATVQITTSMGTFDKVIKSYKIALKSTTDLSGNLEVKIKITIPSDCPENMYTLKISEMVGSESDMLNPSSIGITVQKSSTNPPSVTVLYPNGGESISVGTQVQVSAHATDDNAVTSVTFYYSSNGGSNWNLIGAGTRVSGTDKDGVWNRTWNTNGLSAGTNYLIKAVASDGTLMGEDQSDSAFSLTPSKVIYVPDDYSTIQAAVNSASTGDTIIVRDGVYTENINMNKPHLTIMSENGAGNCIVHAANSDNHVFEVTANYVNITGFTIEDASFSCGIPLTGVNNCNISTNIVSGNSQGIYLSNSIQNIIANNTVKNNGASGIFLMYSNDNEIRNNTANSNNYNGILLNNSNNNRITDNDASNTVNWDGISLDASDNNEIRNNTANSNNYNGIVLWISSDKNIVANNTAKHNGENGILLKNANNNMIIDNDASNTVNWDGIALSSSNNNEIRNNTANSNNNHGITLLSSSDENIITNNTVKHNGENGIFLKYSNSNRITDNDASNTVNCDGIALSSSNNNEIRNNIANSNNYNGIVLWISSDENIVANNTAKHNGDCGIVANDANNNKIYLNSFINNTNNVYSTESTNIWNSDEKMTYTYKGNTYTNYMGNYWDDYSRRDVNGDGIGDTAYSINWDKDYYPLMQPWENYFKSQEEKIFDTCSPANPYPSISGTHTGTITPNRYITVQKLYTYPCAGTGGHTEYVRIYGNGKDKSVSWNGYAENWDTLTFDSSFSLEAGKTYNYTITTGSYPQIHHTPALQTENGWINCTLFTDANGKDYDYWIPAIRLFG